MACCKAYSHDLGRRVGGVRMYSDEQAFRTRFGTIRVNLKDKSVVGVSQSRGERPYQEDAYSIHSLTIPTVALKSNVASDRLAAGWSPDATELEGYPGEVKDKDSEERKKQVAYFGVFDGHGGNKVSFYLRDHLHQLLEDSKEDQIKDVVDEYRAIGGYLKRYRGGPLSRFSAKERDLETTTRKGALALDEMAVLAFLKADTEVLRDTSITKAGSVGTVAVLHSLETPHTVPYSFSPLVSLTIAHLGDTKAILASTSGRPKPLTEAHHPDSRVEGERMRKSGTGIVTDSFGESRWGGGLANTRGVGDREYKSLGVLAEPEVQTTVLRGDEWAFLILVSDGITDAMSDQEVVDLCRGFSNPTRAANNVVKFAEDVGGEDNMTAIVIPLPGWSKFGGHDVSASRREYRLKQVTSQNRRQKRM